MNIKQRLRASGIHLALSAVVAALAGAVVFVLWYPYPYRELSGGRDLFVLLTAVDLIIGPLITLAIFNPAKRRAELRRDLGVVAVLQIAALSYGMWTVAQARPVHLVFEIDRFRAVHAVEVDEALLRHAPKEIEALPLTGPTLLSLRPFRNAGERADATMAALQGVQLGTRPDLWRSYDMARPEVLAAARPIAQLQARRPTESERIAASLRELGREPASVAYLPLVSRRSDWTVLVDMRNADVLGYLPIDSF